MIFVIVPVLAALVFGWQRSWMFRACVLFGTYAAMMALAVIAS